MGAHIVILEAMLCCPHKRDAQTLGLDTLSNLEAEVEQLEQMPNQKAEAELLSEKYGRYGPVVHVGAHIVILEAMLSCPHKRVDPGNLETLSNHEAEVEQQEQCNWTFGSAQIGG